MTSRKTLRQVGITLMLLVTFLVQGTWALAGTTGGLSGTVTDDKGAAVSGASITASAPSGTSTTTTDATGHYGFLSLAPDTYTVSMTKSGYQPISQAGITVFADQTQIVPIKTQAQLREIGSVTARSANDLVKSGTTSDVYSVNAATAEKVQSIGGGGNLNNAYSAIYSQPGVSSYIGNYGVGQVFYIRGSNYNQVGYEFDGVPVNRAFDNYSGTSLSNLGQQELQVYTGSGPAGTSSSTVGGYINQVIKTGTYPGFANITGGLGSPIFYHKLFGEAGGASPNRLFSYYAGVGGYDQEFRLNNQQNGGNLDIANSGLFNAYSPFSTTVNFYSNGIPGCNPDGTSPMYGNAVNCLAFGAAGGYNYQSTNRDREGVFNFHFGIPHKRDSGRDDIQLLYTTSTFLTGYAESVNDLGGATGVAAQLGGPVSCKGTGYCGGTVSPDGLSVIGLTATVPYQDGYIFAPGTTFGQKASSATAVPYLFPNTGLQRAPGSSIPLDQRNTIHNNSNVFKLQYQKNIGTNAYLRAYGYSIYSDWLQNAPTFGAFGYTPGIAAFCCSGAVARDYELSAHSRGGELQFADQINSKNLLTLTGNYVTSSVTRYNNGTMSNTINSLVTNFTDGTNCYNAYNVAQSQFNTAPGTVVTPGGAVNSCFSSKTAGTYGSPTGAPPSACNAKIKKGQPNAGQPAYVCTAATVPGAQFLVTVPGERGTYNTVRPEFSSEAINDEFRPNDKLLINVGLRFEQFKYNLASPGADFPFWYNAAANTYCYNVSSLAPLVNPVIPGQAPPATPSTAYGGVPCPTTFAHPTASDPANTRGIVYNAGGSNTVFSNITSPRLSFTYTVNPETVIRGSAGRFAEPVSTAYVQYLDKSGRSSAAFNFTNFFRYGFNSPVHSLVPQISNNVDLSLEKRLHGTDISFKASPFYRYTTQQLNTISIGPNFASSLNVGTQTTYGLELALTKGDPSRNGLSGELAYTYTHARVKFSNLSNGRNTIDPINDYIIQYNRLTSACAGNATDPRCVGTGKIPLPAAAPLPCYAPNSGTPDGGGTADACTGGTTTGINNPYFNAPVQPLLDRSASYDVYPNEFPYQPVGGETTSFGPNTFSAFLNYKHDRLTVTPTFQLTQGNSYGSPVSVPGLDPRVCANNQAGGNPAVALAGAGNPNNADFTSCNASVATGNGYLAIPNPQTGTFDSLGKYRDPWQFNMSAQIGYDLSQKAHATLVLSNLVNRCFGGSSAPWTNLYKPSSTVCGYGSNGAIYQSNFYNGSGPNDPVNGTLYPVERQPYGPTGGPVGGLFPFNAYFNIQVKI